MTSNTIQTALRTGARLTGKALKLVGRGALSALRPPAILDARCLRQRSMLFAAAGIVGDNARRLPARAGETFDETIARLGLGTAELEIRTGAAIVSSRVAYGTAALCSALAAWLASDDMQIHALAALAICAYAAVGGWIMAYRAQQLIARRWAPFSEFVRAPRAWML